MLPGIEMMNLVREQVWSEKARQKENEILAKLNEKIITNIYKTKIKK